MGKQEKSLFMTFLMTPDMANFSGHIHGGSILKLLDRLRRMGRGRLSFQRRLLRHPSDCDDASILPETA
jgi:hypothetical protein